MIAESESEDESRYDKVIVFHTITLKFVTQYQYMYVDYGIDYYM